MHEDEIVVGDIGPEGVPYFRPYVPIVTTDGLQFQEDTPDPEADWCEQHAPDEPRVPVKSASFTAEINARRGAVYVSASTGTDVFVHIGGNGLASVSCYLDPHAALLLSEALWKAQGILAFGGQ